MPHFKAFGMINLQYEVSICQILYNKGTITNTSWYPFKCNRRYILPFQLYNSIVVKYRSFLSEQKIILWILVFLAILFQLIMFYSGFFSFFRKSKIVLGKIILHSIYDIYVPFKTILVILEGLRRLFLFGFLTLHSNGFSPTAFLLRITSFSVYN